MNKRIVQAVRAALLVTLIVAGRVSADSGPAADSSTGDMMSRVDWWVIAGGGAPSTGTDVTLNDTLGLPVAGSSSGAGDVALSAGYWVGCVAAAAVMPDVTVALDDADVADVVLTWDANPNNAQYQVWISTNPYFDPDHPGGVAPILLPASPYRDAGAAANLVNYFYVVRGLNPCAAASGNSRRTGEFTFGLTPGTP